MARSRPWTAKEDEILRREYPQGCWQAVQKYLPYRSARAIIQRAHVLKVKWLRSRRRWTPEEDRILRELYPAEGADAVCAAIGKSRTAVYTRASKFGLRRPRLAKPGTRWWTPQEDAYLRQYYRRLPTWEIAENLGRTREAVYTRAARLKLVVPRPSKKKKTVKREVPPTMARFFRTLAVYWLRLRAEGVQPDVARFMAEYRKEYAGVS